MHRVIGVSGRNSPAARFVLALAIAGAAVLCGAGARPAHAGPGKQPPAPAGLEWGGTHFQAVGSLQSWLQSRGASYDEWLIRHPFGPYLLTTHPAAPTATTPTASAGAGSVVPSPRPSGTARVRAFLPALYALAVLLLLMAATPYRLAVRIRPTLYPETARSLRVGSASIAVAVALGATAALFA